MQLGESDWDNSSRESMSNCDLSSNGKVVAGREWKLHNTRILIWSVHENQQQINLWFRGGKLSNHALNPFVKHFNEANTTIVVHHLEKVEAGRGFKETLQFWFTNRLHVFRNAAKNTSKTFFFSLIPRKDFLDQIYKVFCSFKLISISCNWAFAYFFHFVFNNLMNPNETVTFLGPQWSTTQTRPVEIWWFMPGTIS